MIPRNDLLDEKSPEGLEVFQITTDSKVPASHLYMEAQIFTPDSKRLILHRSSDTHGRILSRTENCFLLCDLADKGRLIPITDEPGATSPSVSPDGSFFYYFVDGSDLGGGKIELKRRKIDGTSPETIMVLDGFLPGTKYRPSRLYPLSTISSDGLRLAISAFLGDGRTNASPFGLMVFDLGSASVDLIVQGVSWCNMHPQYCRSEDAKLSHDILIQENHGNIHDEKGSLRDGKGKLIQLAGALGADIHVISDDGMDFRNMPWGRNGDEHCQGHQCWRGRSEWAITSTVTKSVSEYQLIEGKAAPHVDHDGLKTADGIRNDLSRNFKKPDFYHFATDIEGNRFISDSGPDRESRCPLYFAELGEAGKDPLQNIRYLLAPRISWEKALHPHPFLSPDGTKAFFNSDESGTLQAYMLSGLPQKN
ncbi:MAG: hypothetical protein A2X49_14690 [Lentisphaerae bacterium GWF2_52_8]|nr:MAG: hypothetical protein A2X49_14690 [Lentisphaerae bacterium GWF2_52_8]